MDYAADLLGGKENAPPSKDYAADLLGPVTAIQGRAQLTKPKQAQKQGVSLTDLDLANADSNENTADFSTLTKAAMVDDPGTKLKILAKARFPGMKEEEAVSRYGIIEGVPVYLGKDDKLYRETPTGFGGFLKKTAANIVGSPGETIGGVAGGIVGAPGGPAGVVAGSALGAAGGKGYDKIAANLALDEPQTVSGNVAAMGEAAAFSGGGSLIGSALGKFLQRNAARDIKRLDTTQTADITKKAQAAGVDLNPAQATNLPSLKAKYDVLASMPTSRDAIAEAAKKQAKQAYDAADDFFKKVSPVEGLDEAGTIAREGAKKVVSKLTEERAAAARPLYKKAFDEFDGIPQELVGRAEELMKRPAMAQAGRKAVQLARNEGIDLTDPKNSLLGMHYMKLALGDMIEGAGVKGTGSTAKRGLSGIQQELVGIMDELSPTYKQARDTFSHFTPNIVSVQDGIISKVAGLGDEQAHKAAQMVFS